MLEVEQGGVTGAKIVKGEGNAQFATGFDDLRDVRGVGKRGSFENLKFDPPVRQRWMPAQHQCQSGRKVG